MAGLIFLWRRNHASGGRKPPARVEFLPELCLPKKKKQPDVMRIALLFAGSGLR